ncbi:MAG: hypothetical protein C4516_04095 [Oxalobacter sp.]|nr:MAG: hypothetical protein C4516_04095 [Oxalobacter sp.]
MQKSKWSELLMNSITSKAKKWARGIGWLLAAYSLSFFFFSAAQAARTIDSVTLNGGSSVSVEPGTSITVSITVTTSGGDDNWQSTGWRIANGAGGYTCVNHANHNTDGTYTETFTITAPTTEDIYNAYFVAYSNNTCSSGASVANVMTDAVEVATAPLVSNIVRASANPADSNSAISWTVTFSRNVTGVDATDFALVQTMGVSGAAVTSVTGSGTTWTVTANTGNGNYGGDLGLNLVDNDTIVAGSSPLGGAGAGNGSRTGPVYMISPPCVPPENLDAALRAQLTCVCDNFNRAAINSPAGPIGSWVVASNDSTGIVPYIPSSAPGYLRLTERTQNNAKSATVPGAYPARGNFISTEFRYYAYNGNSADGIAVTFSDYAEPAVHGAYGGSLGYAQKTGINGFAGGWVGFGIDEYGNYQNPTEGRQNLAVPAGGFYPQSIAVRGSGSGTSGYYLLGGTAGGQSVDASGSSTPAPGHRYQMIVDARNYDDADKQTVVTVSRATSGSAYSQMLNIANVYSVNPSQSVVPDNWQISLTGSTGTSYNIHEIGSLRICAQNRSDPPVEIASGFNAIDEAYGTATEKPVLAELLTGHIYTKLAGTAFNLYVGALTAVPQIDTSFTGNVTVRLVDDENGACRANCTSSACTGKTDVANRTLNFTSGGSTQDNGIKLYNFTVNSAYKNLIAIISNSSITACSTDSFAVRPLAFQSVASSASNVGTGGTPIFKAGSDPFTMTVSTSTGNYTGTPELNSAGLEVYAPAITKGAVAGTFNPAIASSATGNGFTYDEVGAFTLKGYVPIATDARSRGVHDTAWTAIDSVSTKNDCVGASYSNTKNASGKFGCLFGIAADWNLGRFVPAQFAVSDIVLNNRTDLSCSPPSLFTYMGEPLTSTFTLTAQNAAGGTTKNYFGSLAKLIPSGTPAVLNFNLGAVDVNFSTTAITITNITRANPAEVTAPGHGLVTNDWIKIADVTGMTQVNEGIYQVTVSDANTFTLNDTNSSAYTAYDAGGKAFKRLSNGTNRSARVEQISSAISWPSSGVDMGIARDVNVTYRLNRPAATGTPATVTPDGALSVEFGIAPVDSDGVTTLHNIDVVSPAGNDHASIGISTLLFGRVRLSNAHGSEKLDLPIPMHVQYWSGMTFVTNALDSCTAFGTANVALANRTDGVTLANVPNNHFTLGGAFVKGVGSLKVLKPSSLASRGSVDVCIDLGTDTAPGTTCLATTSANVPWLSGSWGGGVLFDDDPVGRASFGVYKSEFIYLREMY